MGRKYADKPLSIFSDPPLELRQLLLDIFTNAVSTSYHSTSSSLVQQVKQNLFNRDFHQAFAQEDFREAYSLRWSPSRALAYINILHRLPDLDHSLLDVELERSDVEGPTFAQDDCESAHNPCTDLAGFEVNHNLSEKRQMGNAICIVCIGAGGGAEIAALGGYLHQKISASIPPTNSQTTDTLWPVSRSPPQFKINVIDIADWASIVDRIYVGITTDPPLSQYASSKAKATNKPLVPPESLTYEFINRDVLNMEPADLNTTFADTKLVTIMFTLNELYTTSITKTTTLLLSLTMLLSPGSLLLVVDSPGSYSTVKIGKSAGSSSNQIEKQYPMQWLLDHTLLEASSVGSSKNASAERQWEKLESRDSEWFRLSSELRYPIDLEDMRYQVHLYRRL